MKKLFLFVCFVSFVVTQAFSQATLFSGGGTAITTNLSYFITSAAGLPARVEYVYVTADHASSTLNFWTAGSSLVVTNTVASGTTNFLTSATNGLAAGTTIVIQSVANDTYQRANVSSVTLAGGIILTNTTGASPTACTTSFALASGDKVWPMTKAASMLIGVTTGTSLPIYQGAIWNAQAGRPALIDLYSTTATTNIVLGPISGSYYRASR